MFAGNLTGGRLSGRFMSGKVSAAAQGIAAFALQLVFFLGRHLFTMLF